MGLNNWLYELSYATKANSPEEAGLDVEKMRKFLEDKGVIVTDVSRTEKKRLAYPIKKESEAYFGHMKFLPKEDIASELNGFLKSQKNILRMVLVKAVAVEKAPRMQKPRKERKDTVQVAADVEAIDKKLEEILGA